MIARHGNDSMKCQMIWLLLLGFLLRPAASLSAQSAQTPGDAAVTKAAINSKTIGENLLKASSWQSSDGGFRRDGGTFVCDNGRDTTARRGAFQTVQLDQNRPAPIVATASSRAEGVTGSADSDYALYLDLEYTDGSSLWGQAASFMTGDHDWQQSRVALVPDRPVKSLTVYLLFRHHGGKAIFRDAELHTIAAPSEGIVFDGVPVVPRGKALEGIHVRDVSAESDFVRIEHSALGLELETTKSTAPGATFYDTILRDMMGKDRAITLVFTVPVAAKGLRWLDDPRREINVEPGREYMSSTRFDAGSSGRLSRYPFGAVAPRSSGPGVALGIDMARPAFYRIGYNAGSGELYLAYDLALTPEKPTAPLRFVQFPFDPAGGFRAALEAYYALFPEAFRVRAAEQGQWMPFAKISTINGWQDFGFKFKEGNDETAWDDAHGIITFRYTEPLTWWMPMKRDTPRTLEAAVAEARRLADRGRADARALFTSGYHDAHGKLALCFLDTPWNNGAVWSMNSMPGIKGDVSDFSTKWNSRLRDRLYDPTRKGDLDGEYVDSSEGYVTDELDFRREHFGAAATPLVFSPGNHKPAIFRGLIAFEYVRAIATDIHGMGKLMMANATPDRLCWLAPWLDVMGTETDWNPHHRWRPMSDSELLYRRALCKGKPFCFLMNTAFESFSHELVEKYMKRALAYGMFPGFFSHNAAEGHYFTRPELYDRDRPLFKKYVPICKAVAQAGWEPITRASSSDDRVYVERFGRVEKGPLYLTVFNDSDTRRTAEISVEFPPPQSLRDLVSGAILRAENRSIRITLARGDVAVIELKE
jgi:hypothetical protein